MSTSFLDALKHRGIDGPLRHDTRNRSAPAAQGRRPAGDGGRRRSWDFAFATGIESSNPQVSDPKGNRLRRDLLGECGHYQRFREDFALVKDLGIPVLRYGLPNHLIHLAPGRYDWSFADEAMAEIKRLGIA